jgi:hypothetical protein
MVSQFGITGIVFHNDVMCRQRFSNSNSTESINENACKQSLANLKEWNCDCRSQPSTIVWMRISNDGSLAMASLLFISLVILVAIQCGKLCCQDETNSFELFSPLGLFAMLFIPDMQLYVIKEKYNTLSRDTAIVVFYDMFAIGLVCQYSSFVLTPFEIVVVVSSCVDIILRFIVSNMIRQNVVKKEKSENVQELKIMISEPPNYSENVIDVSRAK